MNNLSSKVGSSKFMAKILILCLVCIILLSACQPSPQQIQAAIEETLNAAPTNTYKPNPSPTKTSTLTPTQTISPSPTATTTATPTPTATPDLRIIDDDPMKYLLKADELPLEAKYYIPNSNWMSINTNEEVISLRGVEEGRKYVISTGRITGWWVEFLRGTRAVQAPEDLYIFVGKYQTPEGARLALNKYNDAETNVKNGWKYKEVSEGLGDEYNVVRREVITSGGDKDVSECFSYTYRNFMVEICQFSLDKDVTYDFALDIGRRVLKKLKSAPLVFPPTPTPTP